MDRVVEEQFGGPGDGLGSLLSYHSDIPRIPLQGLTAG
jgi:hypothetical protein